MKDNKLFSISDARAFLESLHEIPRNFAAGVAPDWRDAPPHFVPAGLVRSVELSASGDDVLSDSTASPFRHLSRLIIDSYGIVGTRAYFPNLVARNGKLARPMIMPRRAVASGGESYPTDITLFIPKNSKGYFSNWSGEALAYAPQFNRFFSLESDVGKNPLIFSDNNLDVDEHSIVLLLSLNFSRTYYKYREFTYRLSAVDTGVLVGRICQLAQADWEIAVSFKLDSDVTSNIIGRKYETHPTYCAITLKPKLHISDAAVSCPRFEIHPPIVQSFKSELICTPEFSNKFIATHAFTRERYRKDLTTTLNLGMECPVPDSSEQFNCSSATENKIMLPHIMSTIDRNAIAHRKSRAQAFNGKSIDFNVFANCLVSMSKMGSSLFSLTNDSISVPEIWVVVLNVKDISPGLYRVDKNAAFVEKMGSINTAKVLSDSLYLKNFDIQKAGFVVHVCNHLFDPASATDFTDYRIRQMTVGAMLDAGMLVCASKHISAHTFLGFSSRDVEAIYGMAGQNIRVLAQLCVGTISSSGTFDTATIGFRN